MESLFNTCHFPISTLGPPFFTFRGFLQQKNILQGSRSGSKPRKTSPGGLGGFIQTKIQHLNDSRDLGKWILYDNVHISLMMPNISCFASYANIICIQSFAESSVEARILELGCIDNQTTNVATHKDIQSNSLGNVFTLAISGSGTHQIESKPLPQSQML